MSDERREKLGRKGVKSSEEADVSIRLDLIK